MSGRPDPAAGGTGVAVTDGAAGAIPAAGMPAGGATVGAGAIGAGAAATGGVCGRWAPAGTGLVEGGRAAGGMVGGTTGVATLAGGMGVVVGKGADGAGPKGRWPWESVGGMTATPDGIEGKVDGSSNFGVSWAGCES